MNTLKVEKIFFEDDYVKQIDSLSLENNPGELIEGLIQIYGDTNPSFLKKILNQSIIKCREECKIFYVKTVLKKEDYDYILGLTKDKFLDNPEMASIAEAKFQVEKIEFKSENTGESQAKMIFTKLYLSVLEFILLNEDNYSGKKIFRTSRSKITELKLRDRLLILWLLQKHDYLDEIKAFPKIKLLENKKQNIKLLSQLMDVPEKSFGNILADLSNIFGKPPTNIDKHYISKIDEYLPRLEKLAELFVYGTFPDINFNIISKIDDLKTLKSTYTITQSNRPKNLLSKI